MCPGREFVKITTKKNVYILVDVVIEIWYSSKTLKGGYRRKAVVTLKIKSKSPLDLCLLPPGGERAVELRKRWRWFMCSARAGRKGRISGFCSKKRGFEKRLKKLQKSYWHLMGEFDKMNFLLRQGGRQKSPMLIENKIERLLIMTPSGFCWKTESFDTALRVVFKNVESWNIDQLFK